MKDVIDAKIERESVNTQVISLIAVRLPKEAADLKLEQNTELRPGLPLSSLSLLGIFNDLKKVFAVDFITNDFDMKNLITIGSFQDFVYERLKSETDSGIG